MFTMSGFRELRDISNNFENALRKWNSESISAKEGQKIEDVISKKLQDLKLFSSKLKLLRANSLALTPQIQKQPLDNAVQEYGDEATWKVLEHMTVKSLSQAHAVKALITTPNENLDPGLIDRKQAIMESLSQYSQKESELHHFDKLVREREAEHAALRAEWDTIVEMLWNIQGQRNDDESRDRGPLYSKLCKIVDKLEMMRWLIGQLICTSSSYDWLTDPYNRMSALVLTREHNTIEMFTQD